MPGKSHFATKLGLRPNQICSEYALSIDNKKTANLVCLSFQKNYDLEYFLLVYYLLYFHYIGISIKCGDCKLAFIQKFTLLYVHPINVFSTFPQHPKTYCLQKSS